MNRRTFLKVAGLGSVSVAASCSSESDKILYTLVQAPEDMVTGKATWYASTCRECPAGCGVLAKNREGMIDQPVEDGCRQSFDRLGRAAHVHGQQRWLTFPVTAIDDPVQHPRAVG